MLLTRKISENISLQELEIQFGLRQAKEPDFFREWQESLPELNNFEQQALDISNVITTLYRQDLSYQKMMNCCLIEVMTFLKSCVLSSTLPP